MDKIHVPTVEKEKADEADPRIEAAAEFELLEKRARCHQRHKNPAHCSQFRKDATVIVPLVS